MGIKHKKEIMNILQKCQFLLLLSAISFMSLELLGAIKVPSKTCLGCVYTALALTILLAILDIFIIKEKNP